MVLPATYVPFSVTTPFKVRADLYKLGTTLLDTPETQLFLLDDSYPAFIAEKLTLLNKHPQHGRCYVRDDLRSLQSCLWQVAKLMAADQPAFIEFQNNSLRISLLGLNLSQQGQVTFYKDKADFPELGERCFKHLETLEPFAQLCDFLAFAVQEDLVIMHKPDEVSDLAECLLVSLPSHWDPLEKLGLDFSEIHKPVADNAPLTQAHQNLLKAITRKGPFVRYNWSLASTASLSQNPKLLPREPRLVALKQQASIDTLLDSLYFRVERQTLHAFPDLQRGLFAIRIFQEPLRRTLFSKDRKKALAEAIISMSDAMLTYKGIIHYQDLLLAYLAG